MSLLAILRHVPVSSRRRMRRFLTQTSDRFRNFEPTAPGRSRPEVQNIFRTLLGCEVMDRTRAVTRQLQFFDGILAFDRVGFSRERPEGVRSGVRGASDVSAKFHVISASWMC